MANDQNNEFEPRRLILDEKLRSILGNNNTYFQPPESVRLNYPCIVYSLTGENVKHADNLAYYFGRRFDVTHIHRDPDVDIMHAIREGLPFCRFDRRFISEGLYHDVYTIYYK